ncbi:Dynein light chain, cytoplasmic [Schistosoma japonicum]|uniref:Dynein light chain n=1 Tax=Schistosoma japonicum TaxID=6182 RepID=C1LEP4_SCHJA|nr:Dynein light chain, cytoplasmic [Schistosoma japonicum]CAX73172.1 Dynein light chain, flagellar outer arm [Schistosoma japonicum]
MENSKEKMEKMEHYAVEVTLEAMDQCTSHDSIADYIEKIFNTTYSGSWHCKVGKSFGSFDSYDSEYFFHYYIGNLAVFLYKSKQSTSLI